MGGGGGTPGGKNPGGGGGGGGTGLPREGGGGGCGGMGTLEGEETVVSSAGLCTGECGSELLPVREDCRGRGRNTYCMVSYIVTHITLQPQMKQSKANSCIRS